MKSLALIASVMMLATGSANAQTPAVGQQTAAPKATQPASAASREVAAAAAAIVDAFGRHDPKKYFSLFAPDATFVFHTTPKRLNARAEYEAEWAMWEKEDGFRVRSCKSTDQRVQTLATSRCSPIQSRQSYLRSRGQARYRSERPSCSIAVEGSG